MYKRRQRAAGLALLFGAFYFFTEGLAVLFRGGKLYLKVLKHVDLYLPIDLVFWLAETLGLYQRAYIAGVGEERPFAALKAVALGTLVYITLGYMLGFILPVSHIPHRSEDTDERIP
jgi:hypothetical protein